MMKERYCFSCSRRLDKREYLKYNTHQNRDYLIKIWKHPLVELYCCECYRGEILSNEGLIYFPDQKHVYEIAIQKHYKF